MMYLFEHEFEWDEGKNISNRIKHGVSFETAKKVFYDSKRYEMYDFAHSLTEDRWRVIGLAGWHLLTVVFTEKNKKIRIISARQADSKEQEEYFYGNGQGIQHI